MSLLSNSKTLSVYGGAGGRGTRISTQGFNPDLSADKKSTMQGLNTRLASYLDKVRSLEKSNADLEKKIRDWYASHDDTTFDHTPYQDTINELKNELQSLTQDNAKLLLELDNSKLAVDDFKRKYENELALRREVEADIAKMRKMLDDFSLNRSDLEMEIEALKDELIVLRNNHAERKAEINQTVSEVNVSVDAAPSTDLNHAMSEIRQHYENVTEKNRKDLESWYEKKINTVQQEVVTHNEELQSSRSELKELTSIYQRLQIELQACQSMKSALEGDLDDTQARYANQLAGLQTTVTNLEDKLSQCLANIAYNKQEYDTLLDVKTRLEREIAEYRRLLDGNEKDHHKIVTKTITVVETTMDGKVVDSNETVDVNELDF